MQVSDGFPNNKVLIEVCVGGVRSIHFFLLHFFNFAKPQKLLLRGQIVMSAFFSLSCFDEERRCGQLESFIEDSWRIFPHPREAERP